MGLAEHVWAALDRDPLVVAAVERGVVNYRALSRWLIHEHGLDATEEAVLSAIRRRSLSSRASPFAEAARGLSKCHVNVRTRVSQILAPMDPRTQRRLAEVFSSVDPSRGDLLYVTARETRVNIIVDEANRNRVAEALGRDDAEVVSGLATLMIIRQPDAGNPRGMLAIIAAALSSRRINIRDVIFGFPEGILVVDAADAHEGFRVLDSLLSEHGGRAKKQSPDQVGEGRAS